MTVQEFLTTVQPEESITDILTGEPRSYSFVRLAALCADGYCISIQNSEWHQCDKNTVEVAIPDKEAEAWFNEHGNDMGACDKRCRWGHLYGWVNMNALDEWLQREHGGIVGCEGREERGNE